MKKSRFYWVLSVALLLQFIAESGANAQTIIKQWSRLAESPAMIDVDYQITQCNAASPAEVYLQVFNEKPAADTVKFDLVITDNATNQSFTTAISKPVAVAQLVRAKCGSTAANDLKIQLPSGFNPANLSVSLTFTP